MNNKKFIIIFGSILVILMLGALGFIVSSNIIKNENKVEIENKNENEIDDNKEIINVNENIENNNTEEKYQNVMLTSKIGAEILSKFCISNIYSSVVYDEIDKNGLSEEAKLIYTYVTITSNYNYHNMVKYSDEFGDYITKEDFETVYKELFGNKSVINHKSVITDTLYNEEKGYYEYLTIGYGGIEFDFIVEIPYKIKEYDDRVEALFYRLYCKAISSLNENGEPNQLVKIYDNSSKISEIYSSNDVKLQDNDSQQEFITELIEDNTIDKNILETVTYTLIKENDTYYISDVKR